MLSPDQDWLVQFIEDYRTKLATERLELAAASARMTSRSSQHEQASHHLGGDDAISHPTSVTESTPPSCPRKSPKQMESSDSSDHQDSIIDVVGRGDRLDAAERKRKQQEYHRFLDRQLAEKREKEEQELRKRILQDRVENLENAIDLNSSRTSVRSPSPPIKSHYRNVVPFRVPPRPLTANCNEQRLSDLTELRQLYSNR